jgi:hypothetical protein
VVYDPRRPQTVLVGASRTRTYATAAVIFLVIALVAGGFAVAIG